MDVPLFGVKEPLDLAIRRRYAQRKTHIRPRMRPDRDSVEQPLRLIARRSVNFRKEPSPVDAAERWENNKNTVSHFDVRVGIEQSHQTRSPEANLDCWSNIAITPTIIRTASSIQPSGCPPEDRSPICPRYGRNSIGLLLPFS